MKKLSDKQRAVLNFINKYALIHQRPPTLREIGEEFGISSTNGVRIHLKALKSKGYLEQGNEGLSRQSRAIATKRQIPIVGTVAAGSPVYAEENQVNTLGVGSDFEVGDFVLVAEDDEMAGAGIMEGDHVIIQRQDTVQSGDVAVAQRDGVLVLRSFFQARTSGRFYIERQHSEGMVEDATCEESMIVGKVIGLLRRYH
jgi:repressor LexA|tara:strand:- start:239 stop:835 length:597 start_codon:yes stop_codon:yes gene_type:complete